MLGQLVTSSRRLSDSERKAFVNVATSAMFTIRSKEHPEVVFFWHGKVFLDYDSLYSNERSGPLWDKLVRIALGNKQPQDRNAEMSQVIE